MTPPTASEERLEQARLGIHHKLMEIERRVHAARERLDPHNLVRDPWVQFGLAFAAGFLVAHPRRGALIGRGLRAAFGLGVRYAVRDLTRRLG